MTVQELICALQQVSDKSVEVEVENTDYNEDAMPITDVVQEKSLMPKTECSLIYDKPSVRIKF